MPPFKENIDKKIDDMINECCRKDGSSNQNQIEFANIEKYLGDSDDVIAKDILDDHEIFII